MPRTDPSNAHPQRHVVSKLQTLGVLVIHLSVSVVVHPSDEGGLGFVIPLPSAESCSAVQHLRREVKI